MLEVYGWELGLSDLPVVVSAFAPIGKISFNACKEDFHSGEARVAFECLGFASGEKISSCFPLFLGVCSAKLTEFLSSTS